MPDPLPLSNYRGIVGRAIAEDLGDGDVTTSATVPAAAVGRGDLIAKSICVLAGLDAVRETFAQLDARVRCAFVHADGDRLHAGEVIGSITGPAAALLIGERTALNFLQYLSGIATVTRAFVDAAAGQIVILDTRKTTPGLRALAKYAVRCGGATNHRSGLHDGVLIKDNHIRLAGGIAAAVARIRERDMGLKIEVETQSLAQVEEALAAGAEIIMLDNLDIPTMRKAIATIAGRARVEISGNVTLERVPELAALGADYVSVGALTHSAPAADISLEIEVASGDGAVP
ncbi:MAG TPA: carboxylating nicotinate-nucleotide diphosphorylase [Vicinamibacterales bacterium]|nr:carboxylating nicotinate-nucleotide diphosphorylase [Vicinamibacterales bacterium]